MKNGGSVVRKGKEQRAGGTSSFGGSCVRVKQRDMRPKTNKILLSFAPDGHIDEYVAGYRAVGQGVRLQRGCPHDQVVREWCCRGGARPPA